MLTMISEVSICQFKVFYLELSSLKRRSFIFSYFNNSTVTPAGEKEPLSPRSPHRRAPWGFGGRCAGVEQWDAGSPRLPFSAELVVSHMRAQLFQD